MSTYAGTSGYIINTLSARGNIPDADGSVTKLSPEVQPTHAVPVPTPNLFLYLHTPRVRWRVDYTRIHSSLCLDISWAARV